MRVRISSAMLAALLACSAQAGIYKTVGPDGKVTYSDHPPATPEAQYDLIGKSAAERAPAPPPAAAVVTARTAGAPLPGSAKVALAPATSIDARAAAAVPAAATSGAGAPAVTSSALEGAIIGVLGIEDIVHQTEDLCRQALPAAFGKYTQAASEWRSRNHVVVMQAHHAIAQGFNSAGGADAEQRIENAIRLKNQGMFQSIARASTAERIRWCDDSVDQMHDGALDLSGKPRLIEPLRSFR